MNNQTNTNTESTQNAEVRETESAEFIDLDVSAAFEGPDPLGSSDADGRQALAEELLRGKEESRARELDFVQQVLDEFLAGTSNRFVAQKVFMGATTSYISSIPLHWIARHMGLFTSLPMFAHKIDSTGAFIVDEQSVLELKQRAPNWSRQEILTQYLFRQHRRKFPPMLVVVQESWVDNPDAAEWDADGRATKTSMPIFQLSTDGELVILDLQSGTTIYILDGSHRFLGIKGVEELLRSGKLTAKQRDGSPKRSGSIDYADFIRKFGIDPSSIQNLLEESIGVEFIPAVIKGETWDEARIRVRSTFVHVNKTAQPPTTGENIILDEEDGFALVAKALAFDKPLFCKVNPGDRINWKSSALPAGSHWLTTGPTLVACIRDFLTGVPMYEDWKPGSKNEIPIRPQDAEIDLGVQEASELFDLFMKLPAFQNILNLTATIDSLREFPASGGSGHLLLRPIGQQIFAGAIGYLMKNPSGPAMDSGTLEVLLTRYDNQHGFEFVDDPKSHWYGLTYNPHKKKMDTDKKDSAADLLRHLLHDALGPDEKSALLGVLKEARNAGPGMVYSWDGTTIPAETLVMPMVI